MRKQDVQLSKEKQNFGQVKVEKIFYRSFAEMPNEIVAELSPTEYAEMEKAFSEGGTVQRDRIIFDPNILN